MQTQILEQDAGRTKLQIDIPASDVSKAYQQVLGSIARQIRVPGFRPGKAPRGVIETRVGKDAIAQEVRDALVQTYLPRAVSELSLTPVSQHLHAHEPVDGQDYSFEAVLELYPDFSLPDLGQIVFDTEQPPVTDDLMETEIAALRRQYATLIPVERAAAEGDYLTVETVPSVEGEEGSSIPVDLENVTPELAAQFVGRSIGEEIELTLSEADEEAAVEGALDELAEEYGGEVAEALADTMAAAEAAEAEAASDADTDATDTDAADASADADTDAETATDAEPSTLRVVLRDVREKELPEADDEFAKTLGMDTWAEVEAQVRRGLETRLAQEALAAQQEEFTEKLLLETPVAVPPSLKARRKNNLLQNLSRDLEGRNLTLQSYLESLDAEEGKRAEFERELDETAEAAVKRDLVLERVLEARGTTLPDAEFEAAIAYTARRQNTTPPALKRELGENGLTNYRFLLTRDKAVRETVEELVRAQNGQASDVQASAPTPVQTAEPSATDPVQSEE